MCAAHAEKFPSHPPWENCLRACPDSRLLHNCECFGQLQGVRAAETLKSSQKFPLPPWETHLCSLFAGRWCRSLWRLSVNRELPDLLQHSCRCACSRSKFPIAPMGDSRFARCLQGGGVDVGGGTVTISSCTISGNTAGNVRAHAQNFPSPPWESC